MIKSKEEAMNLIRQRKKHYLIEAFIKLQSESPNYCFLIKDVCESYDEDNEVCILCCEITGGERD